MGGYYVPNIQRPGFGYQRRSEDDEDEFDGSGFGDPGDWGGSAGTPASDGPDASGATGGYSPLAANSPAQGMQSMSAPAPAVQNPDWLSGMDWTGSSQQDNPPIPYASPSRGGADTAPTETEANLSRPAGPEGRYLPEPPEPQDAETTPTSTGIPGIGQPPMGRPSKVPPPVSSHAEQEKLKQMIKAGPKRSVLGTILAGAAGFGAGYVNAASRTRNPVPVPQQAMRNLTWRAPGGGAWDTKLARQKELAEQEQGEEKRALSAQQIQAQAEERQAQAKEIAQRGDYLSQIAKTGAKAEEDRQKQQQLQRITQMGGRTPQIRYYPADNPPAEVANSSDWYVKPDPYDPHSMIAVRPDPGQKIDDETADLLGIARGSTVSPSTLNAATRAKISAVNAAQASSDRELERLRREAADKNTVRHQTEMEGIAAGGAADRTEAREQRRTDAQNKALQGAEDSKKNLLIGAERWGDNERNKVRTSLGYISDAEEARIKKAVLAQKQAAYNSYAAASRQYGGAAYDVKLDENGDPIPITEGYLKGQKPTYLPGETAPTPTAPAATPARAPTGGGRGGRGNVPPPVNTSAQTQVPPAEKAPPTAPQGEGVTVPIPNNPSKSMHFASREAAVKFFKDRGYDLK
jgi:hypothetical protein